MIGYKLQKMLIFTNQAVIEDNRYYVRITDFG
jgi:hypothetical protein